MPDPHVDRALAASTRRAFLTRSLAVAGAAPLVRPGRLAEGAGAPRAKAVIQVFLRGGLSHLDTFDPKPDAPIEVRGEFRSVPTAIDDGVRFSDRVRSIARVADKLTVIRSMTHTEAAHERGVHTMLTGYQPSPAIVYPSYGSVVAHELGSAGDLPAYVCVPNARETNLGTGYLSAAYGPFSIGSEPNQRGFRVRDLVPPGSVDDARLERRRELLATLDRSFRDATGVRADAVESSSAFYDQAWRLIESEPARAAFRIDDEPAKVRDRYGRTTFGQRLLLARRLAEAGVRWIVVTLNGFDNHRSIFPSLRRSLPAVDRAFAALVSDLEERGQLDSIAVLLTSEFGRTPRVNPDAGRDHWPKAFTALAAGAGFARGRVVGATDATGSEPSDTPISPADLAATTFTELGIDPTKRLMSPGDRPIDIVRGGRVRRELLA